MYVLGARSFLPSPAVRVTRISESKRRRYITRHTALRAGLPRRHGPHADLTRAVRQQVSTVFSVLRHAWCLVYVRYPQRTMRRTHTQHARTAADSLLRRDALNTLYAMHDLRGNDESCSPFPPFVREPKFCEISAKANCVLF